MDNKKLAYLTFVFLVVVFWNMLEFVLTTFITRNGYTFTLQGSLVVPLITGCLVGYLLILRK